jgi:hypothetical protein
MKTPRSRKAMIDYLSGHFRYNTMNSWNQAHSYAANVKIQKLTFPNNEARNRAYDLVQTDEAMDDVRFIMQEFDQAHDYEWQVGFNGRSGGYIVLYQGGRRKSQHKSVCTNCGQRNFRSILPPPTNKEEELRNYFADHQLWVTEVYLNEPAVQAIGLPDADVVRLISGWKRTKELEWALTNNVCGVCHKPTRINREMYETYTHPGKGTDMGEDFEEWSTDSLRDRVKLVMEFDRMVEQCIAAFVNFCANHEAEEETYMVPKKRLVAKEIA